MRQTGKNAASKADSVVMAGMKKSLLPFKSYFNPLQLSGFFNLTDNEFSSILLL
jgi:hypothetical protein